MYACPKFTLRELPVGNLMHYVGMNEVGRHKVHFSGAVPQTALALHTEQNWETINKSHHSADLTGGRRSPAEGQCSCLGTIKGKGIRHMSREWHSCGKLLCVMEPGNCILLSLFIKLAWHFLSTLYLYIGANSPNALLTVYYLGRKSRSRNTYLKDLQLFMWLRKAMLGIMTEIQGLMHASTFYAFDLQSQAILFQFS